MTTWGVTRWIGALALILAACSGGDDAAPTTTTDPSTTVTTTSTTAPERPASTTTTAFDPASVEGQVEAAYLKSWDVYADAVYNLKLDEPALKSVYAGDSLDGKLKEIRGRIEDGRAALVRIDHDYQIVPTNDTQIQVIDVFVNHQVLIDPTTKEPVEADPNEKLLFNFTVKLGPDGWRVTHIQRVTP